MNEGGQFTLKLVAILLPITLNILGWLPLFAIVNLYIFLLILLRFRLGVCIVCTIWQSRAINICFCFIKFLFIFIIPEKKKIFLSLFEYI